jgi:hypothetical protein
MPERPIFYGTEELNARAHLQDRSGHAHAGGGDVLFVEATKMRASSFQITGSIGNVMQGRRARRLLCSPARRRWAFRLSSSTRTICTCTYQQALHRRMGVSGRHHGDRAGLADRRAQVQPNPGMTGEIPEESEDFAD